MAMDNTQHLGGGATAAPLAYRMIALDLDGTLTNHDKEVTPLTREALLRAQDEGAVVVLASGRPTYGIMPVADCLELEARGGYILAYNGGQIIDCRSGEVMYSKQLPDDILPVLYSYARSHGHALLGYVGDEIVTESPFDEYVQEESRINRMDVRRVDNLLASIDRHPTKLLMTGDPAAMAAAEEELAGLVHGRIDVFRSAPFFVELVPQGIDKAQSLLRLLTRLGLTPQELMAFGDGYNDLSMLKFAGLGIAMANAAPEVRAEADWVTLSNEHDGVAHALERWLHTPQEG